MDEQNAEKEHKLWKARALLAVHGREPASTNPSSSAGNGAG